MRGDLIARMRLAYRDSPHLLKQLDKIAEGDDDADLVQDLNDLAVSGRDNWALFRAVGGTTEHLDDAAQASDQLAGLLAAHEAVSPDDAKELRDRAFAHLWAAVQTIHKFGKLAFRKDPRRARGYRNHYRRVKGAQRRRSRKADDEDAGREGASGAPEGVTDDA